MCQVFFTVPKNPKVQKSHNAGKKLKRGDPLVSPGIYVKRKNFFGSVR